MMSVRIKKEKIVEEDTPSTFYEDTKSSSEKCNQDTESNRTQIHADETNNNKNGMDEGNDVDDVVVREIDVYLSPELVKSLYLLQYPLLQHDDDDEKDIVSSPPISSARFKPRHGVLEIDHQVPSSRTMERNGKFDLSERTYHSHTVPIQTHLCLGKLRTTTDNNNNNTISSSLHLVPLTHICQMRPSFRHVDEAYEDPRLRDRKLEEEEAKAASAATEMKPLTFKRKESERAQIARLSSYAYKKQSEENEEWYDLTVQQFQSRHWHSFMKKMECSSPLLNILKDGNDDTNYISSLNYLSNSTGGGGGGGSLFSYYSENNNDVRTITARLVSVLSLGCQVPYSLLRAKFGSTVDEYKLLSALDVCCVLVRGNYTLQSKYLNIDAILQPVRTFILFLLEEEGFVDRTRLAQVFQAGVTQDKLFALLSVVAKRICITASTTTSSNTNTNNNTESNTDNDSSVRRGWIPKIEDDDKFIASHPNQIKIHKEYWTKQKNRFQKQIHLYSEEQVT